MPTEPLTSLLDRDLSIALARERIDTASRLMRELVNFSTKAFARCADSAKGEENEDAAALSLYLHVIEMADGAEVLISQCCSVPVIPLLRSSFEAFLSLEYLFEAPEEYARRSLSWLVDYIHAQLAFYEMMDPSTDRGKQFHRAVERDAAAKGIETPPVEEARREASNLRAVLTKPQFEPIETEWQRLRESRRRRPSWYQLFDGPSNMHQMARRFRSEARYEVLYRKWSSVAHASDFSRVVIASPAGPGTIRRLRDPDLLGEVMQFAPLFLLRATHLMIRKFRPGELPSFGSWYRSEVRGDFRITTLDPS